MDLLSSGTTLLAAFPTVLTAGNWLLSLFFARKERNYLLTDLKQLMPASMPFLSTQWPFLIFCFAGFGFAQFFRHGEGAGISSSSNSLGLLPAMGALMAIGLMPILKLFYVTYMGSKHGPGLVSTIGIWSVMVYIFAETLRVSLGYAGLFLFIIPGLLIATRTSLFLPVYALEGHKPWAAIKRSWSLTDGHYWLVSRYLGLPAVFLALVSLATSGSSHFKMTGYPTIGWMSAIGTFTIASTMMLMGMIYSGLTYQLYSRLTESSESSGSKAS